jgi:hypothetical protein
VCKQFALVPLGALADKNDTPFPVHGSGGTAICPIDANSCCFNPGEDVDGNAVVSALLHRFARGFMRRAPRC